MKDLKINFSYTPEKLESVIKNVKDFFKENGSMNPRVSIEINEVNTDRTEKQNRSLHKWFDQVAWQLNNTGRCREAYIDTKDFKYPVTKAWTKNSFKDAYFKPLMIQLLNKYSTTELTTKEVDEIAGPYIVLFKEWWDIDIPFPSRFQKYLDENKITY